ncbi:MAG: efflux RND transporter permease subunit [Planctomycetes bacterium]|nr:efflux RND transporter permease subunit [Planctomycetota bacterium]
MNLTRVAMRRPVTVLVIMVGIVLAAVLSLRRMAIDIFPDMGVPIIYVAQPYGGMDPAQMEGFITNYYEYHFLYISGIEHVESKNIQGAALMKLYFHPGTDMAQAMAETIAYVNRSRAFMPVGTVPPFVMRFDAGSVPVGFLVLSSETRSIKEIQDRALFRVRPMFASLPGVSAPPPFGGSARTVVARVDPDRLHSLRMTPDDVVDALTRGNLISPSGNAWVGTLMPVVRINSVVSDISDLTRIPIRDGNPGVYLGDIATVEDGADVQLGSALVDGRKTVYIAVTKRADASTLSVVHNVKAALPKMQAALPDDIRVSFEFDQSPYVTRAMRGLALEGLLGAVLTGLMVLLFLRDWRSALIVVLNIPLALFSAIFALWLTGQTVNIMTLGGLALAVGILVDEATVAIENIHTHMARHKPLARAALDGSTETTVPRLLAMLCVLAVFIPSFFMVGAARALFVPLSLAVGFSMMGSYLLSSTFVPVMTMRLFRERPAAVHASEGEFSGAHHQYGRLVGGVVRRRLLAVAVYLAAAGLVVWLVGRRLGVEIFPTVDSGQFQIRLRAPDGTRYEQTEVYAIRALAVIDEETGGQVGRSLGYVGLIPSAYPVNTVHLWMGGPHEAMLRVELRGGSGLKIEEVKERLRGRLAAAMPEVTFSFEAGDIINAVMSFGSPTPIEVAVSGPDLTANRAYAERLRERLGKIDSLRDVQFAQALRYPTIDVQIDRQLAGLSQVNAGDVTRSMVAATSSSRFVVPNFWADPKSGIGYQVQIEIPRAQMESIEAVRTIPVKGTQDRQVLLRDVARVDWNTMPGEFDRYNMQRMITITANVSGEDLGGVSARVTKAIRETGDPPAGATVSVRGQIPPLQEMLGGLSTGLVLAIVVILLLLAGYFQSVRLAVAVVSTVPAVLAGVVVMLFLTGTTVNVESFMGTIMAVGVAVANAILLVTFAERGRMAGAASDVAAVQGAQGRLRPILMTSAAMIAGMIPMALGLGESGQQVAPLGRAVIGGLAAATMATLLILPSVFAIVQGRRPARSASYDPDDPHSVFHDVSASEGGTH